jgi:hypothetical protein
VAIAASRGHPNTIAIAALNILLGWTMLGWIASLVWALTAVQRRTDPSRNPIPARGHTKPCPFCAEPVLAAAIKCRHCGSEIAASIQQPGPLDRPIASAQRRFRTSGIAIAATVAVGVVLIGWLTFRAPSGGQAGAPNSEPGRRSEVLPTSIAKASNALRDAPSNRIAEGEARPTFDCAKARSAAETLICQDRQLSGLDVQLASLYAEAKASAADRDEFRRETSAAWADREKRCVDKRCLLDWYANRAAALLAQMGNAKALQTAQAVPLGTKESGPGVLLGTLNAGTFENCCIDGRSTATPFWSIHLLRPIAFAGSDFNPAAMLDVQLGGFKDDSPGTGSKGRVVTVLCSSVVEGATGHYAERAYCTDAKVVLP